MMVVWDLFFFLFFIFLKFYFIFFLEDVKYVRWLSELSSSKQLHHKCSFVLLLGISYQNRSALNSSKGTVT